MSDAEAKEISYPVGSRVIVQGLKNGTAFNGKVGVVKSKLSKDGRQRVKLTESGKALGVKPMNLKYNPLSVESLSVPELKAVLAAKKVPASERAGDDATRLQEMVKAKTNGSGEELAKTFYQIREKKTEVSAAAANPEESTVKAKTDIVSETKEQMKQQASMLENMSQDQLRQQAQMMMTLPPSEIRKIDPSMANLSDEQIKIAAQHFQAMALNRNKVEGLVERMQRISTDDLERVHQIQHGQ